MEEQILLWIQEHLRVQGLSTVMITITTLGNGGFLWLAIATGLLCFKKTRRVGWMTLGALLVCALFTNVCLKNIVNRTRPYECIEALTSLIGTQKDKSFPSGHTASSFAEAYILWKELPRKYGLTSMFFALCMGCSRIYVGVHYPSDVFGGCIIGILSGMLVRRLFEKQLKKQETKEEG